MTRVLLTGLAGFIGSHVAEHLQAETDWDIVGLASFRHRGDPLRLTALTPDRVTVYHADLTAPLSPRLVERIGPVLSPRHVRADQLQHAAPAALLAEPLLHTSSRPQAWPAWAERNGLAPQALTLGQGFEHLYYLLEAAAAGLGVAIAPQQLVADDLAAGRLIAPWGFAQTRAKLALWVPLRTRDPRAAKLAEWLRAEQA